MNALAAVLSVGIGVSLGLLGGGGSILALPVLVYVAGLPPAEAVAPSLVLVGTTSLIGGMAHARSGRVDRGVVALFGGAGLLGAFLGAHLTRIAPPRVLMLAFAAVMLTAAGWMARGARRPPAPHLRRHLALPAGVLVGVLTGFLGVGGGFLIVPALVATTGLDMRAAVGTSLFIIALNSAAGVLGHVAQSDLHLGITLVLTLCAVGGALVAERFVGRIPAHALRRAFSGLVILVALYVIARTLLL